MHFSLCFKNVLKKVFEYLNQDKLCTHSLMNASFARMKLFSVSKDILAKKYAHCPPSPAGDDDPQLLKHQHHLPFLSENV